MQAKFLIAEVAKKSAIITLFLVLFGCKKENTPEKQSQIIKEEVTSASKVKDLSKLNYNLEVVLYGEGNSSGHVHFRQDKDPSKIITLNTKVHHLKPHTEYLLQRAVDTNLDGNCTGTNWLTLGHGLEPESIITDDKGNGDEELWRDVSVIASGTTFDIHFRVIDKITMAVVLTSDCYQYTVR